MRLEIALIVGVTCVVSWPAQAIEPQLRRAARERPYETVAAAIRLPDASAIAALEATGVRLRRAPDGRPRRVGSVYAVDGPAAVLASLADRGWHVEIGRPEWIEPTMVTGTEIGSWAAQASGPVPLAGPTGRGVTILDIDQGIDLFHPHFFQADGGAYSWVDLDGDGVLTPGVDGFDTNLDGEIDANEILVLMDYASRRFTGIGYEYETPDGVLDPAYDYLYVDFNGNGKRDYGAGYSETTPGYGEPLFLPDDANGDRTIDEHERVLLLKTSKIAAYRRGSLVWRRGVDLIEAPRDVVSTSDHGTSVFGILVGGQDRLFRAHRGLVGDADIALFSNLYAENDADFIEGIAWGIDDEGADVVLHEYSQWMSTALDGSRALDVALEESHAEGIVHVCPAGNLGESGKHGQTASNPAVLDFTVPSTSFGSPPTASFWLQLHWRAPETELQCTLRNPASDELALAPGTEQTIGTSFVMSERWDSAGGTSILELFVDGPGSESPGAGDWSISCAHRAPALVVHGYLTDPLSGWGRGVEFTLQEEPTTSLCSPSTSNGCLAVAAYKLQNPYGAETGAFASYSSRGPRMDGGKTMDIAAPADPFSAYPSTDDEALGTNPNLFQNNYHVFSGTSGAGPHVAAAAVQLREAEPELSSEEIWQRLFESAAADDFVGPGPLPDDGWGHGKLRVYDALYGEAAPQRPAFLVRGLEVELVAGAGECTAMVSVRDVDWESPSFRWDDDYDGTWDSEFEAAGERAIVIQPDAPRYAVRVEFGNAGWRVGGAAITGEVPASCFEAVAADSSGSGDPSTSTGDEVGTTASDDSGTSGTSDPGLGAGELDDGCGCSSTRPGAGWWALVLLALGRRRAIGTAHRRRRR